MVVWTFVKSLLVRLHDLYFPNPTPSHWYLWTEADVGPLVHRLTGTGMHLRHLSNASEEAVQSGQPSKRVMGATSYVFPDRNLSGPCHVTEVA